MGPNLETSSMHLQHRYGNKPSPQNASWRIDWDLPDGLEFCSYVGQIHDFRPDATIGSRVQPLKRDWIEWWKRLYTAFASKTALSFVAPSSLSVFEAQGYEPPLFPELEARPQLQTACREHWPYFNQVWNGAAGEKRQLNERLSQLVRQLDLNELVQNCMQLTGKSGSVAFTLQIGVVRWPEDYRQPVSKECLLIGTAYLEREQRQSLISLLQTQICDLISAKS